MLLFGRSCTNQLQIALVSILSSTFLALVLCKFLICVFLFLLYSFISVLILSMFHWFPCEKDVHFFFFARDMLHFHWVLFNIFVVLKSWYLCT